MNILKWSYALYCNNAGSWFFKHDARLYNEIEFRANDTSNDIKRII